jgi:hypothetical protein
MDDVSGSNVRAVYVSGSRVRAVLCVPGSNVLDTSGSHIRSRLITWTMDDVSGPNAKL